MINEIIKNDLIELGIKSDDTILMHSSLSQLGFVDGGADTVIDSLLAVLTDGTLLIPALSYATVRAETPLFSANHTPSCVGKISETFRKREGVIRSIHPTHSVCGIGKYAEEILSQHINTDTPAGKYSPFALLPKYNGKILMLGCGLKPNTSMHAIEELTRPEYLMKDEPVEFELIDQNGNGIKKSYECHNFRNTVQRYDRLADVMDIKKGKVLKADCYLIDSVTMWEKVHKTLEENNLYFVDKIN